jgi:peptide/nickel transport system permease protein
VSPWTRAWRRLARDPAAAIGGGVAALVVLLALLAPAIAPHDPNAMPDPVALRHLPPGVGHLLGTDAFSRDILSRLLFGARVSLAAGIGSAALAVLIGGTVGLAAALAGPVVDGLLMRAVDVLLALPRIFLLMVVLAFWEGVPLWGLVLLIAGTGWFDTSRLVRQHARALKASDFVTASRALGGRAGHVLGHLLPHVASTIIVSATLDIGGIILLEAGLSYLGLGLRPPTASWGNMILEAREALFTAPWEVVAPGIALVVTAGAFNLLGDALRDALDPRAAA